MLRQIVHNDLGVVTQDGCMVGMRANGYKEHGFQRIRVPLATITNRVTTARKHIGGCCNWDHHHAKCCGTGMSYAHGYTQTQRNQWQRMMQDLHNETMQRLNPEPIGKTNTTIQKLREKHQIIVINVSPVAAAIVRQ